MSGLSIRLGKTTITAVMQTIGLAELLMINDETVQDAARHHVTVGHESFGHDMDFLIDRCRAVTERKEYDLSIPMSAADDDYFQSALRRFSSHKFVLMSASSHADIAHILAGVYFYIKSESGKA